MNKSYIGDGVYAELDGAIPNTVVLTTENGIEVTNRIVLEPEVLDALYQWLDRNELSA
jgi:hypothetical protein